MNSPAASGRPSDDDLFVLLIIGLLGMGAVMAAAAAWWARLLGWLLTHQVLVPGREHPLLRLPNASGAGLDLPRVAVAAAVLLLLAAAAVSGLRHRRGSDLV